MSRTLEYAIKSLIYLAGGFAGVWVSSLLFGTGENPFTSVIPYIVALGMLIFTIKEEEHWN